MNRSLDIEAGTSPPVPSGRTDRVKPSGERVRELVDRAVGGDTEAFGGLYDLFADDLYRYFYAHLGSYHDSEDLVSRTFMRAWRGIGRFRWKGRPFEAWLFTLARNQLTDFYRERRTNVTVLDEARADGRPGPEHIALAEASAQETREALQKLTGDQRQVLVLKFFMDRDNHEIAAIMGKREGTVRALQMRALQSLRRHLRDE